MPALVRPPSAANPFDELALLSQLWAGGPMAYDRCLIAVLDAQTSLWKDVERNTANLWQAWLGASALPPSAQPLLDASKGLGLLEPAALQQAWAGWAQVWVNALRHDATEA